MLDIGGKAKNYFLGLYTLKSDLAASDNWSRALFSNHLISRGSENRTSIVIWTTRSFMGIMDSS